jgi:hypothetical protein
MLTSACRRRPLLLPSRAPLASVCVVIVFVCVCLCAAVADYTVCIELPPPQWTDPDAYYERFKQYGDIVFITVCLNNGALMQVRSVPHGAQRACVCCEKCGAACLQRSRDSAKFAV